MSETKKTQSSKWVLKDSLYKVLMVKNTEVELAYEINYLTKFQGFILNYLFDLQINKTKMFQGCVHSTTWTCFNNIKWLIGVF